MMRGECYSQGFFASRWKATFFFKCMQPRFLVKDKQGGAVVRCKQCNMEQDFFFPLTSFLNFTLTLDRGTCARDWKGLPEIPLESFSPLGTHSKSHSMLTSRQKGSQLPVSGCPRAEQQHPGHRGWLPAPSLLWVLLSISSSTGTLLPGLPPLTSTAWPCSTHALSFVQNPQSGIKHLSKGPVVLVSAGGNYFNPSQDQDTS